MPEPTYGCRSGNRGLSKKYKRLAGRRGRPADDDVHRFVWVRPLRQPWACVGRASTEAAAWDLALAHPVVAVDVLVLPKAIDPNVPAGASRARG